MLIGHGLVSTVPCLLLQNRFLIVFGGGSVANCYNDVVMLDTKTLEWSTPQTTGTPPTPRAGTRQAAGADTVLLWAHGKAGSGKTVELPDSCSILPCSWMESP